MMAMDTSARLNGDESFDHYLEDDIARALRASLVEVLTSTLADGEMDPDFLRGIFSLARTQAGLYGISWLDLVKSLCDTPQLCHLVWQLQEGTQRDRVLRHEN